MIYEIPPNFEEAMADVTVHASGTAVFTCKVCGRPWPNVTWRGPDMNVLMPGSDVKITATEDGAYTLKVR